MEEQKAPCGGQGKLQCRYSEIAKPSLYTIINTIIYSVYVQGWN